VKEPRKAPSVRAKRGGAAQAHAAHARAVARGRAQGHPKETARAAARPPGLAKAGDRSRGHGVAKGRAARDAAHGRVATKPQAAAPRTRKVTRGLGHAAPPAATPTRAKKPAKRGSSAQRGNGGGTGKKAHGAAPRLGLKPRIGAVPTVTAPQLPDGSAVGLVKKSSKLSRKFVRGPASP